MSMVPDDVRAVGQFALRLAEDVRSALGTADRAVKQLVDASWTGDAAKSFGSGWAECADGGNKILDALATLAEKLGVAADSITNLDGSRAAQLRATGSSLNLP